MAFAADKLDCFESLAQGSDLAQSYCLPVLESSDENISVNDKSRILISLAGHANKHANFTLATQYLQQAIEQNPYLQEANLYRYNWLRAMATAHFSQDDYIGALPFFEQALTVANQIDRPHSIGTSINDLASTYMEMGQYRKAMEFYFQSLTVFESLENHYSMAISLSGIGIAHRDLGELTKAVDFLQRAIRENQTHLAQYPDFEFARWNLHSARYELALAFVELRAGNMAEQQLLSVEEYFTEQHDNAGLAKVLIAKSRVSLLQKNQSLALSQVLDAKALIDRKGLNLSLPALEQWVRALYANGLTKLAIEAAEQGVAQSNRQGHFASQLFFRKWLGDTFAQLGRTQESVDYLQQYVDIYTQFLTNKYDSNLADLSSIIQVQQQQKDIALLQKEKQLAQAEIALRNRMIGAALLVILLLLLVAVLVRHHGFRQQVALNREIALHREALQRLSEQDVDVDEEEDESVTPADQADVDVVDGDLRMTFHKQLVELLNLSCEYWELSTGLNKLELAERSKIWLVVIDDGRLRARTMDKYLSIQRLPKKPRWRQVIRTCRYVLVECDLSTQQRDTLNRSLEQTLAMQREIATESKTPQ